MIERTRIYKCSKYIVIKPLDDVLLQALQIAGRLTIRAPDIALFVRYEGLGRSMVIFRLFYTFSMTCGGKKP